jgi:hypothetical protein
MKPIETLCDRLTKLAEYVPWETFEEIDNGHLVLVDPDHKIMMDGEFDDCRYSFYLRVGLYMNRPVQAIISCGSFIRIRSGKKWEKFALHKIEPIHPETSLYPRSKYYDSYVPQYAASMKDWDPQGTSQQSPLAAQGMQQMQLQQMQQMPLLQQLHQLHQQGLAQQQYAPLTTVCTFTLD